MELASRDLLRSRGRSLARHVKAISGKLVAEVCCAGVGRGGEATEDFGAGDRVLLWGLVVAVGEAFGTCWGEPPTCRKARWGPFFLSSGSAVGPRGSGAVLIV